MGKKKGFTLVEVIVSLAILGIIAISFLGAISSHFTYMTSTKNITQDAFKAQEMMEYEIDEAKERVMSPSASLKTSKIFNTDLGGIDVKYEEVKISHNNKDYYTLVSNVKPDPLEIISLESIGIKLMQGSSQMEGDYYGYPTDEFSIVGNFSNKNIYKWDHLLNQVEWYVSSDTFNIPKPKNESAVLNDDEGHYYPIFPRDYEIFSNETVYKFGTSQNTFSYIDNIAGRHIIYTVTPAAKSGKLGERKESKPIFISGLTVTDNLITHLDASYIDFLSGTTEAQKSGTDYLLNRWYDISSITGRNSPNEWASPTSSSKPIVNRTDAADEFSGQYVKFDSGKFVQINQGSSGGLVTIYTVLKNRDDRISAYALNGDNQLRIEVPTDENKNKWNIVCSNITLDGTMFEIGNSMTDIAELVIYSGSVSDENNSKILNYLTHKYSSNLIINNTQGSVKEWNFNYNTKNWAALNQINGFGWQTGGYIGGTINGVDPHCGHSDELNIPADSINKILLRLKNNTSSTGAEFYYETSEGVMDEYRTVKFNILPNSDFTEYEIDVSTVPYWSGMLKKLRLDPAVGVSTGSFSVDYIRLYE